MKNIKFHRTILIFGLILWVSQTAYFGFNETAQSGLEKVLDFVSIGLIIWGFFGDVLSGITINKYYKTEHNIDRATFKFFKGSKAVISDKKII